jgi:hypothetical protein
MKSDGGKLEKKREESVFENGHRAHMTVWSWKQTMVRAVRAVLMIRASKTCTGSAELKMMEMGWMTQSTGR